MSSLFFTCRGQVSHLPDHLRVVAERLLSETRTVSCGEMAYRYSNEGTVETEAALAWMEGNNFGMGEVYFWRGTNLTKEMYEAIATDSLESYCLTRGARFPFIHEYIRVPCLAFASGSHLYGIAGPDSDWDALVLANDPVFLKTNDTDPSFRIYNPGRLFQDARRGLRHAWEFLTAPQSVQMTWDTSLEEKRQKALETLSKVKIPWRDGSRQYFETWYPHFFIHPDHEPYPSVKRWKIAKGWPYKLGYYIFVDAYLSRLAEDRGEYQTIIADQEITSALCRMKQGDMVLQEWLDLVAPLLPEGCDLKDNEGRWPAEYREVQAHD